MPISCSCLKLFKFLYVLLTQHELDTILLAIPHYTHMQANALAICVMMERAHPSIQTDVMVKETVQMAVMKMDAVCF